MRDEINYEYFEWMYDLVCKMRYSERISFRKLLMYLHNTEFVYIIPRDGNRAEDGVGLRYRFALNYGYDYDDVDRYITGPCSVLEMMIRLAIRCEEEVMDDPRFGDRTGQWFWHMITNMGLGSMVDNNFDEKYVKRAVDRFLNRRYDPDGKGGLFRVRDCDTDMRDVEIWIQLCWYLDTIV